jgi:hypothetical protein
MDAESFSARGLLIRCQLALAAVLAAAPVGAHHSFAMFDNTRQVAVTGVVKEVQWTNPHVWIQILVPNARGQNEEWGVECTSVNFMARRGWTRHTLNPGDHVTLMIAPLRDGSHGGSFRSVSSLNGAPLVLGGQEDP